MRRYLHRRAVLVVLIALPTLSWTAWSRADQEDRPAVTILKTPKGVRFGVQGEKGQSPAATLFVFASRIEDTLGNDVYNKVGRLQAKQGVISVSLDVPCHGEDTKAGEPAGLSGWRTRIEKGDDLIGDFVAKVKDVLDHLVEQGYTDPKRVAVCGTSRGGFIALHVAAAEPRFRCAAAFAPVTNPLALSEFNGMANPAPANALSIIQRSDQLSGRAIWVCIGNHDQRVSTDDLIAFTRKVVAVSIAQNKPANVELHVMPSLGHSIHSTAHDEAASWITRQFAEESKGQP
jgi:dienelactone hydrolase